jgi:DNA (cytosine-5)-methyltransferase 1
MTATAVVRDHVSGSLSALDKMVVQAVPPGGNWRDLPEDFPSARIRQIRASAAAGMGSRSTYYGRLEWDRPSYTISTYITRPGNGCFIHPDAPRLLTVREAARLQTFPDDWRFQGTLRQRAMQIGNAVPPLLAYQIARQLPQGSAVDLFAGVGGLSSGLHAAGHQVVLAVDYDEKAVEAYQDNMRHESLARDLSDPAEIKVVIKEIRKAAGGSPDLIAGGPPCQGFSTAGPCLADDPRNRLLGAFVEAVEVLRPRTALMENVQALGQSRGRKQLEEVISRLRNAGYSTATALLHAEAYGVPQRRRRFFLMASRGATPAWPHPWLRLETPAFPGSQPHQAPDHLGFTVRDAIGDLPREEASTSRTAVALNAPVQSRLQAWMRGVSTIDAVVPGAVLPGDTSA